MYITCSIYLYIYNIYVFLFGNIICLIHIFIHLHIEFFNINRQVLPNHRLFGIREVHFPFGRVKSLSLYVCNQKMLNCKKYALRHTKPRLSQALKKFKRKKQFGRQCLKRVMYICFERGLCYHIIDKSPIKIIQLCKLIL